MTDRHTDGQGHVATAQTRFSNSVSSQIPGGRHSPRCGDISPAPDQHSGDVPLNRYPNKNNEIKSNTGASGLRNFTNKQLNNLGYYTIQTPNPKSPELLSHHYFSNHTINCLLSPISHDLKMSRRTSRPPLPPSLPYHPFHSSAFPSLSLEVGPLKSS